MKTLALLLLSAVVCSLTSCANFEQQYKDKTGLTIGQTVGIAGQTYDQVAAARAANRAAQTSGKQVLDVQPTATTSAKQAADVQPTATLPAVQVQGEAPAESFNLVDSLLALWTLWRQ